MKLEKGYSELPFSFLVNDTRIPSNNPLILGRTFFKITFFVKIKTTDIKIEQKKAQKLNC